MKLNYPDHNQLSDSDLLEAARQSTKGDIQARWRVALHFVPLINATARKCRNRKSSSSSAISHEDIVQHALTELVISLKSFDPDRDDLALTSGRVAEFAKRSIWCDVVRHVASNRIIKCSQSSSDVNKEKIDAAKKALPISVYSQKWGTKALSYNDRLCVESCASSDDRQEYLEAILSGLSESRRKVLEDHYGLNGEPLHGPARAARDGVSDRSAAYDRADALEAARRVARRLGEVESPL